MVDTKVYFGESNILIGTKSLYVARIQLSYMKENKILRNNLQIFLFPSLKIYL